GPWELVMIEDVDIGPLALPYIRECLSVYTLPQLVAQLPLELGRVHAYLPAGADPAPYGGYDVGGILPPGPSYKVGGGWTMVPVRADGDGQATRRIVHDFIAKYLLGSATSYAVFQDLTSTPDDLGTTDIPHFLYESEVYRFIPYHQADSDHVERMMQWVKMANARLLVGILTWLPPPSELLPGQEVNKEFLAHLATGTKHVIVGAFDGEGELIWNRDAGAPVEIT
ncbi:MAG TPA: hypothetical protein VM536_07025, partial [Chloroflexia bacterium]|nr:hypothetical protein [Chloroflexia bacterium]